MSLLSTASIRLKILLIPIVGILGFAAVLAYNFSVSSASNSRLNEVKEVYYPILEKASASVVALDRITETFNSAVTAGEQDMIGGAEEYAGTVRRNLNEIEALEPRRKDKVAAIKTEFEQYFQLAKSLSQEMIAETLVQGQLSQRTSEMASRLNTLKSSMESFRVESHEIFTRNINDTTTEMSNAVTGGLLTALVTFVAVIIVSIYITSNITGSLSRIVGSLKDIAQGEGDLTRRIPQTSKDEIGELVYWFNSFVEKLQGIIREVVEVTGPLSGVSNELSSLARQSERVTADQLDATRNAERSISEMFASLGENASNASNAADAAAGADNETKMGQEVVDSTISAINVLAQEVERAAETIRQLEADTTSVGNILDVIQGIAGQTNLLALNAAIEAARAGEQGRGFAVVADEVRTLASRTQVSTQEIHSVIEQLRRTARAISEVMEQGQKRARESVDKAAKAGESLSTIAGKVETISNMNIQIASATEEQQQTSSYIQRSVEEIRSASEHAANGSRKVAEATEQLTRATAKLSHVTGQFRV